MHQGCAAAPAGCTRGYRPATLQQCGSWGGACSAAWPWNALDTAANRDSQHPVHFSACHAHLQPVHACAYLASSAACA